MENSSTSATDHLISLPPPPLCGSPSRAFATIRWTPCSPPILPPPLAFKRQHQNMIYENKTNIYCYSCFVFLEVRAVMYERWWVWDKECDRAEGSSSPSLSNIIHVCPLPHHGISFAFLPPLNLFGPPPFGPFLELHLNHQSPLYHNFFFQIRSNSSPPKKWFSISNSDPMKLTINYSLNWWKGLKFRPPHQLV